MKQDWVTSPGVAFLVSLLLFLGYKEQGIYITTMNGIHLSISTKWKEGIETEKEIKLIME